MLGAQPLFTREKIRRETEREACFLGKSLAFFFLTDELLFLSLKRLRVGKKNDQRARERGTRGKRKGRAREQETLL